MNEMDNELLAYTASYIAARMAILLGFGYTLYRVLRPARARASGTDKRRSAIRRPNFVPDDRY